MRVRGVLLAGTLWIGGAGVAVAQEVATEPAAHGAGDYAGVKGEGTEGRLTPGHKPGRTAQVLWIGFQNHGGEAVVFVQLDREAQVTQAVDKDRLIVTLAGASFGNGNARRALDTRFFDTALARVEPARARGKHASGIQLVIRFKDPASAAQAQVATSKGKDGLTYVTLGFAAPAAK